MANTIPPLNFRSRRAEKACTSCHTSHKKCDYQEDLRKCSRCSRSGRDCSLTPATVSPEESGPPGGDLAIAYDQSFLLPTNYAVGSATTVVYPTAPGDQWAASSPADTVPSYDQGYSVPLSYWAATQPARNSNARPAAEDWSEWDGKRASEPDGTSGSEQR
ncbi:hypothetical protein BV22DRAFT_1121474 [Leucogyrophana mollusca]|uniref:Uncharacterized protein n=1 Tax=Leucogyrophana mollusca TaxID=85980 RepID=A0ACB8B9T8_9AGAM|nr:hypothetical protein BV22DRAFT_1121474 [Leucogyrophana mollusca]